MITPAFSTTAKVMPVRPWAAVAGIGRSLVRLGRRLERLAQSAPPVGSVQPPERKEGSSTARRPSLPTFSVGGKHYEPVGYWITGQFRRAGSASELFRDLLADLWRMHPEAREAMRQAMQRGSRGRAYVALQRERLYPHKSPAWVAKFSRELPGGWWVGTNENPETFQRLLARALRAAGLVASRDVVINWRMREVEQTSSSGADI